MPYLSIPGVDLWYEDAGGSGTPVVLLHAASGTTECWVNQLPTFTAAGYRCISYDRRTWGRSGPRLRPAARFRGRRPPPPCWTPWVWTGYTW